MRPTVFLFDIDGTLLTSGGAGRKAMDQAFDRAYGRPDACNAFSLDGMTDKAIVRQGLEAIGAPVTPGEVDRVLGLYVERLEAEVRKVDADSYRLHPGMAEAVEAARARPRSAVGLGTGNIREGARVKLARVNFFDRFSFGGFGCDAEARPELILRGAERGAEQLGVPLASCRVVVIGDTPKDVDAALAIGAECVGVGTGRFRPEALLAAGATCAFPDLAAPGALEALLGSA
jgi:phosphoglycolate phosphatase-like HAD superfamily hydrolase